MRQYVHLWSIIEWESITLHVRGSKSHHSAYLSALSWSQLNEKPTIISLMHAEMYNSAKISTWSKTPLMLKTRITIFRKRLVKEVLSLTRAKTSYTRIRWGHLNGNLSVHFEDNVMGSYRASAFRIRISLDIVSTTLS